MIRKILYAISQLTNFKGQAKIMQGYWIKGQYLEHVRIANTTCIESKPKLILSEGVFIGHYNFIEASHGIEIGEGCQVTNYCSIITHSSHVSIRLYGPDYPNAGSLPKGYATGPVRIGKYSFIGPHSTIMPGTTIGKGCLVSAYSYVKGEFPDFAVISGNPAVVTGDIRNIDRNYLEQYPEMQSTYKKWTEL